MVDGAIVKVIVTAIPSALNNTPELTVQTTKVMMMESDLVNPVILW